MAFENLLPDLIFDAVSRQGFIPTGYLFPLNSYENRVYEIRLEEQEPVVAKFYRPGRWSAAAIAEEHRFIEMLREAEVPVVAPLPLKPPHRGVQTLSEAGGFLFALYPKFRGREHSETTNDDRRWLGRMLARLHNIGEHFVSRHRLRLTPETYGDASLEFILSQPFLPADMKQNIEAHLKQALDLTRPFFKPELKTIPLHGDCHPGNILWGIMQTPLADGGYRGERLGDPPDFSERRAARPDLLRPRSFAKGGAESNGPARANDGPHFLDFDDMVVAPPVQDLWMLFYGETEEKKEQQKIFFEGYETFRRFDTSTLILTEPLRTLRMIRHAAWIGQRYTEPIFQKAFPYYEQRRYWEGFLLEMKEQLSLLNELNWN